MIVGFSGLKGSGKDLAASYLVQRHGFRQFSLGDEIYRQLAKAFNVPENDLRSRAWKETVRPELALRNCRDPDFVSMIMTAEMPNVQFNVSPYCTEVYTCPRNSTFIAQQWATEYRRGTHGNDYWANLLAAKLMHAPRGTKVVISDIREDHEVEVFEWFTRTFGPMKCGIAEIVMPGRTHTGHSSDNGLSRQFIDSTINNTPGDLPGFLSQVDEFLAKGMKWKLK